MYINRLQQTQLKVKAKSLAAEARIIRKEERKGLKHFQATMYDHQDQDKISWKWSGYTMNAHSEYINIRNHRTWDVRQEARATHIARTFLNGKAYSSIERGVHDEYAQRCALHRASQIIAKYGNQDLDSEIRKNLDMPECPPVFSEEHYKWIEERKKKIKDTCFQMVLKWTKE